MTWLYFRLSFALSPQYSCDWRRLGSIVEGSKSLEKLCCFQTTESSFDGDRRGAVGLFRAVLAPDAADLDVPMSYS